MSDTDDGFDKEAARRELREKYEDEREDRETTARMSELLLQGATMTNQHCDRCGSPIFRYEGREFCPTCQHEADEQATADQAVDEQSATRQDGQSADQSTAEQQPADRRESVQQPTDQREPERQLTDQSASARTDAAADDSTADSRAPPTQTDTTPSRTNTEQAADAGRGRSRNADNERPRDGDHSRSDAEATLESTISTLARRAAAANDPRTATEYLEAVREAADALAALRHNA